MTDIDVCADDFELLERPGRCWLLCRLLNGPMTKGQMQEWEEYSEVEINEIVRDLQHLRMIRCYPSDNPTCTRLLWELTDYGAHIGMCAYNLVSVVNRGWGSQTGMIQ